MTATYTDAQLDSLVINRMTKQQYESLPQKSDTELYIVDPQFQGGKFLASDANGDIVEKDALTGATIDGTDLSISDNKVDIPLATTSTAGVSIPTPNWGISVDNLGRLSTVPALENEIALKTQENKPIVPNNLDIAIREGLGNNSLTWTDAYKESACNTIGASQQTEIVDWIDS